jgi:hypothetical protein
LCRSRTEYDWQRRVARELQKMERTIEEDWEISEEGWERWKPQRYWEGERGRGRSRGDGVR